MENELIIQIKFVKLDSYIYLIFFILEKYETTRSLSK